MRTLLALALLSSLSAVAQTTTPARPFIRAVGEATVTGKPDQARLDVAVVNQAPTAQQAASQNAERTTAVVKQMKQLLGTAGEVKTANYMLNPNYSYPKQGGTPTITGYNASNTVEVTINDLSKVGAVIDAAVQVGGNQVNGIRFTLKDDEPLRREALQKAAVEARQHADAIATGLGAKTGAVIGAEEGVSARPIVPMRPMMTTLARSADAVPTPVEAGSIDVHATVTLEVELVR